MGLGRLWSAWLAVGLALGSSRVQDKPEYVFGTTVVDTSGLRGRVYYLKPGTHALPKFEHLRPVGSIYTPSLNVWPQNFDQGNISDRFEWFAIEYTGRIWIETPGHYRFSLLADDGAKLYLNNEVVINNDGQHEARAVSGSATLTRGIHEIKVQYFQGPRFTVALVLAVSSPSEPWRIFNMNDFKPPNDPEQLQKSPETHDRSPITIYLSTAYADRYFSWPDQLRAMETLADLIDPGRGQRRPPHEPVLENAARVGNPLSKLAGLR
jgi:hypothetical protein